MKHIVVIVILWVASTCCAQHLPTITEHVDTIAIVYIKGNCHQRVVFVKDNTTLATRMVMEDMTFSTTPVGGVVLTWQDYVNCYRIVTSDELISAVVDDDPTLCERGGPWWCMRRNMRDLKTP